MLQPKKVKHRKQHKGRMNAEGLSRQQARHSATTVSRPCRGLALLDCAADRGRSYRDDAPREAWWQGLDPGLSGQAQDQEAGRDPDG